jgi:hypothetical protein
VLWGEPLERHWSERQWRTTSLMFRPGADLSMSPS